MLEQGRRLHRAHGDGIMVVVIFSVLARGRCPRCAHGDNDTAIIVVNDMLAQGHRLCRAHRDDNDNVITFVVLPIFAVTCRRHRLHHGIGHGCGIDVVTSAVLAQS